MCPRGEEATPNYWKKMKVIVIPISFKPSVQNKCGTSRGPHTQALYRVTHHVVQNLPLTSKQKVRFGLDRPCQSDTFVFKSTGGFAQRDVSP